MSIDEIEQQWEDDVLKFGDEAFKLWHCYGVRDYPVNKYVDFSCNYDVYDVLNYGIDDVIERKPC